MLLRVRPPPPTRRVAVAASSPFLGHAPAPPPPITTTINHSAAATAARPSWAPWAPPTPVPAPPVVAEPAETQQVSLPLARIAFNVMELLVELAVIVIVFRWLLGSMTKRSQSGVFDLLKSKTTEADDTDVTFADVAGNAQAKQDLEEMVDFLKAPEKYLKLGARIPKGLLLTGPPGCGKTLLAKAVAGEADVPFFAASGAEFLEMFVGVGSSRMRDLFRKAKDKAPAIIFIDEIDAIGKSRGGAQALGGGGGGSDEREQTLNQLLIEMDGFATDRSVLVIAATNRPDVLDDALLRPGRFDRKVAVERPDRASREAILAVHTRNKPLAKDVVLSRLAGMAPGFSGADLENWANEAAMDAARRGADAVDHEAFARAFEHLVLGPQRSKKPESYLNTRQQRIVAYHEAGHALAGMLVENYDRLRRVTILSRGASGGATYFEPNEDDGLPSRDYLRNQIVVALGGRAAEELVLGAARVTAGAHSDLRHATAIARRMVAEYGFSDALGKMNPTEDALLCRGAADDVARETRALLDACYTEVRELLSVNEPLLHRIAEELIKHETMDEEALLTLFRGMACGVK